MLSIITGPIFFVLSISVLLLGGIFLTFQWRQGFLLMGMGAIASGCAIPGWLSVVGGASGIWFFWAFWYWSKHRIGRSF